MPSFPAYSLLMLGLLVGWGSADTVQAQPDPDERTAVMQTVQQLFDGMRAGDSTQVRAVFTADARLMTVGQESDRGVLRTGSLDRFVEAVGQPREAVWDERIWDVEVRIDRPMATVWAPYAFYLGDTLSHCGVNAMQLIRRAESWKIFQLADTRQQDDCTIPPDVQK